MPEAASAREPRWQDAVAPQPELVFLVRPRAVVRDATYGPLLRRALELASARGYVSGQRMLEAIESAEQAIVILREWASRDQPHPLDLVMVLVGVSSSIDPGALVDDGGQPLWNAGPAGGVRELVGQSELAHAAPEGEGAPESLFELPGRVWVLAAGGARQRARDAFLRPVPRRRTSLDALDSSALAAIRIDGRALVLRTSLLRGGSGLAAVGHGLVDLSLELLPGVPKATVPPVHVVLTYRSRNDADASIAALLAARDAIRRKKPAGLTWFADATIEEDDHVPGRSGQPSIFLEGPLPPELAAALLFRGPPETERPSSPAPPGAGDSGAL